METMSKELAREILDDIFGDNLIDVDYEELAVAAKLFIRSGAFESRKVRYKKCA